MCTKNTEKKLAGGRCAPAQTRAAAEGGGGGWASPDGCLSQANNILVAQSVEPKKRRNVKKNYQGSEVVICIPPCPSRLASVSPMKRCQRSRQKTTMAINRQKKTTENAFPAAQDLPHRGWAVAGVEIFWSRPVAWSRVSRSICFAPPTLLSWWAEQMLSKSRAALGLLWQPRGAA